MAWPAAVKQDNSFFVIFIKCFQPDFVFSIILYGAIVDHTRLRDPILSEKISELKYSHNWINCMEHARLSEMSSHSASPPVQTKTRLSTGQVFIACFCAKYLTELDSFMNKLMKIMEVVCLMNQRIETLRYAAALFPPGSYGSPGSPAQPSFDLS